MDRGSHIRLYQGLDTYLYGALPGTPKYRSKTLFLYPVVFTPFLKVFADELIRRYFEYPMYLCTLRSVLSMSRGFVDVTKTFLTLQSTVSFVLFISGNV